VTRTALALLLLLSAGAARAEESAAGRAVNLPGNLGLAGMQDMVDARVPKLIAVRAGLRYALQVRDQDFRGAVDATRELERHDVIAYAGASLLGLADAAVRFPFVYRRDDTDLHGVREQFRARYDEGWGDLDVAGKVGLSLGDWITVAPFAFGRLPTGEPDVRDLARFEWGAAATISVLNQYVSVHGNVAGLTEEEGLQGFRYRLGVSLVPVATDPVLLRIYGYGDGLEYEGRANSDFDLDFGVQAILFKMFTVELGSSVRIVDAGYIDDTLKDTLRAEGIFDRHFRDDGTWELHLSVGVVIEF
jgi:hypothetical protein